MKEPRIGVRHTGQFIGTIDGKDVSPTSFDIEQALEVAETQFAVEFFTLDKARDEAAPRSIWSRL